MECTQIIIDIIQTVAIILPICTIVLLIWQQKRKEDGHLKISTSRSCWKAVERICGDTYTIIPVGLEKSQHDSTPDDDAVVWIISVISVYPSPVEVRSINLHLESGDYIPLHSGLLRFDDDHRSYHCILPNEYLVFRASYSQGAGVPFRPEKTKVGIFTSLNKTFIRNSGTIRANYPDDENDYPIVNFYRFPRIHYLFWKFKRFKPTRSLLLRFKHIWTIYFKVKSVGAV